MLGREKHEGGGGVTAVQLRARLVELERQRQDTVGQVNAIMGAIQDVGYWLAVLEGPAPVLVPAPPPREGG